MPHIAINFDAVPDKYEMLPAGEYLVRVDEAKVEPTKDGKGQKCVVKMVVDDEGNPHNGRQLYDHLSLQKPIGLKQLLKSCGLEAGAGGFDPDALIGQHARVLVKGRTYQDAQTGETKETASVERYLFEDSKK